MTTQGPNLDVCERHRFGRLNGMPTTDHCAWQPCVKGRIAAIGTLERRISLLSGSGAALDRPGIANSGDSYLVAKPDRSFSTWHRIPPEQRAGHAAVTRHTDTTHCGYRAWSLA